MSSPILASVLAVLLSVYVIAPPRPLVDSGAPAPPATAAYASGLHTGP